MNKLFLSLVAAGLLLSACNHSKTGSTASTTDTAATTTANAANAPVMKFEKESHDFGKIKTGDKVSYDFKFTNTGKSPLIISDAHASCGCTIPDWPKAPIKPGDNGVIKVTFNSAGKSGLMDKQITVTGNTVPAQTMVHLIGEVLNK